MAIDGGLRGKLAPGTRLTARYRGVEHVAKVVTDGEGKTHYRLADGREFKSPSAAGSAVMGGTACNGWRFWSLEGTEQPRTPQSVPEAAPRAAESADEAAPKQRPQCPRCEKSFVGAKQLAHHEANADRLCQPAAVESTEA